MLEELMAAIAALTIALGENTAALTAAVAATGDETPAEKPAKKGKKPAVVEPEAEEDDLGGDAEETTEEEPEDLTEQIRAVAKKLMANDALKAKVKAALTKLKVPTKLSEIEFADHARVLAALKAVK